MTERTRLLDHVAIAELIAAATLPIAEEVGRLKKRVAELEEVIKKRAGTAFHGPSVPNLDDKKGRMFSDPPP